MLERLQFPSSWNTPALPGYGTFPAPFVQALGYENAARHAQSAIEQALIVGYRHFDTAFAYRNQDLVGAAVRTQGVSRAEVFVTSKLHPYNNSQSEALSRTKESIRLIWGDEAAAPEKAYLDAFLIHYPAFGNPIGAWKGLVEAREQGLARHIGVSNFEIHHLELLYKATGVCPELNQIEFHPYIFLEQRELAAFCRKQAIALEGYCPLAEGAVLSDPEMIAIAAAHHTTPAAVALRWCMQHGIRPIVGSRNPSHIRANAVLLELRLSDEEMNRIDSLSSKTSLRVSLNWHWNAKTAPLGGPIPRQPVRRLLKRCASLLGRG